MTSKNRLDGLQFRIMETLEQAKNVPLSASEIADRLHSGEYHDTLKDTLVYKVAQTVHVMKNNGKIVVADARARGNRLTYQLPQRMVFPPKTNEAPANPVLTPELAEQIITVSPKTPTVSKPRGVYDQVVDALDVAPHPLAARELVDQLKGLWDDDKRANGVSQAVHYLTKTRRIYVQPSSGRVRGAQYEYYTKKTGKPAPAVVVVATPPSRPKATGVVFRPITESYEQLKLSLPQETLERVKNTSKRFGITPEDLCRQAIEFALEHAE